MRKIKIVTTALLFAGSLSMFSCSENKAQEPETSQEPATKTAEAATAALSMPEVQLSTPLNQEWVTTGKGLYEMKCQSCHKLTDEKLVGPGWKGVTQRRQAGWILNMITHPDEMLNTDGEAQKLLEICLVRMPNQNVTQDEARHIIEFMRSNDGVK
ncbi:cytochrome c [Chitinophagaceae bacterium LB-8]|uniref:Cytochrome c n=1 Tax=Paraflavisolibacter caeni TaxID=2982496 RepID=A0A9X3BHF0_9BACT|nr:c-type cytochrome [Paraflavisolibacter caeni]MCU7549487.1 cytochrome c [Paraflavisolibacter caeni]